MSNDKTDATFHPENTWPRPMGEVLAQHGAAPEGEPDHERPWASPGAPPWAGQIPPKPKSKVPVWLWVAMLLSLVACSGLVIALTSGNQLQPVPTMAPPPGEAVESVPSADKPPAAYKVGRTFQSGDFQYTVHGVKTGLAKVGDKYLTRKAQGAFTRLDITVKNVGDEAVYFDADNRVKVEDKAGRQFSADTGAAVYGNPENGWATEINPGNAVRAYVFFDLPKGTTATRAVISPGMLTFEADAVVPLS